MSIVKKIHLVFLRRDEIVPPLFKECERRIRDMHPSWNVTLWDEVSGIQFLKDSLPTYMPAYMSFTHNVQRADSCWLYHELFPSNIQTLDLDSSPILDMNW